MKRQFKNHQTENEPELSSGNRSLPFTTPEGYFDALPGQIQRRIELLDPESAGKEHTGFELPERYFDQLEAAIHQRTHNPAVRPTQWWKQPEWSLSIAALLVCLFLGTHTSFKSRQITYTADAQPLTVDEVSEVIDYLDLDAATVANLLPVTDESGSGEHDMKQYLLENDIDLSQLEL